MHVGSCVDVYVVCLQAYGDAVLEEAPLFAISTYDVTIFCHRNFMDVKDKRIWASPPIAWNSTLVPPRAAWLHFLSVAKICLDVNSKDLLVRSQVPVTPQAALPMLSTGAFVSLKSGSGSAYLKEGMR